MIVVVDYGVGNLFSQLSSFSAIGQTAIATSDVELIKKADKIILHRTENGMFSKIDDIKLFSGISDALFEKIKDSITV